MDTKRKLDQTLTSHLQNPANPANKADESSSAIGKFVHNVVYTIQSFIANPFGTKGLSAPVLRAKMEKIGIKYRAILNLHHGAFKYNVFKVGDSVIINVKVPSESVTGAYYDVAVEFLDVASSSKSLLTRNIRLFSNSFTFVYKYAYLFNKQGMVIPYYKSKLPPECFTNEPEKRNPDGILEYEKSILFAMLFIRDSQLYLFENYSKHRIVSNKLAIKDTVHSFADMSANYRTLMHMQAPKKGVAAQTGTPSTTADRTKAKLLVLANHKTALKAKRSERAQSDLMRVKNRKVNSKVDNRVP